MGTMGRGHCDACMGTWDLGLRTWNWDLGLGTRGEGRGDVGTYGTWGRQISREVTSEVNAMSLSS